MKNLALYYFSGTGNSQFIAQNVCKKFEEKGFSSNCINIEDKIIDGNEDITGFVLPVYGFGIPHTAIKFINKLPKVKDKKAFVLLTPAGHEGIGIIQTLFLLKNKGYDVILADKVLMPDTWILVMNAPTDEKLDNACQKADNVLAQKIESIIENKKKIVIANPLLLLILGYINLVFYLIGRFQSGKMFTTNSKCNSCGICQKSCPSNTIKWKNNKPYWGWSCVGCFRCINTCPQNAIETSNFAILGLIAIFIKGGALYKFIPAKIAAILAFIPFSKSIFILFLSFIFLWAVNTMHFYNLLPAWYTTAKRRRYKISKE